MSYDVRLAIRTLEDFSGYSVELILPNGRAAREETSSEQFHNASEIPGTLVEKGAVFASLLWRGSVAALLAAAISEKPPGQFGRILFECDHFAMSFVPWESVMFAPPLAGHEFAFIYSSDTRTPLAGVAPRLPLRFATAAVGTRRPYDVREDLHHLIPNPDVNVARAFQITELSGTLQDTLAVVTVDPPDLLHLRVKNSSDLDQGSFNELVDRRWIAEAGIQLPAGRPGIRLLMLHIEEIWEPVAAADGYTWWIRMAQSQGAPAIIVTNGPEAVTGYFYFRLFEQLVHDQPIDVAFLRAQSEVGPLSDNMLTRLFLCSGTEDLLRVSSLAEALRADAEDAILEIQAALAQGSIYPDRAASAMTAFENVLASAETLRWDHESTGLLLLADLKDQLDYAGLVRLGREPGIPRRHMQLPKPPAPESYAPEREEARVVNVAFLGREGIVPGTRSLAAGTRYDFRAQIGRRLPESILRNPAPVPDAQLVEFMRPEGLPLRLVLSSRQFELIDDELELVLPPKGPSEMLHFRVRSPRATGPAQLRAALYYEANLLQSIRVTADIVAPGSLKGTGNSAEVEYCICGTLRDVEMYEPRSLSLLLNESHDGTHTFAVVGSQIRENFSFTEGEMNNSLAVARKTLLAICTDLDKSGKPTGYRYNSRTNSGSPAQFVEDVKKLAYAGRDLYTVFVTNKNQAFAQQLRRVLAQESEIQIASTRSAKYVFPWALVYDKLLVQDDTNVVCEQFLSDISGHDRNFRCLSSGCPNADDFNVICPSGFWGYRHIVEQPPSIAEDDRTPGRDLPMYIDLDGDPRVMMAISLELEFSDEHYKQLSVVRPYQIALAPDKGRVVKALLAQPVPNLVYFYCHGGKDNGKAFLGIGNKQQLLTGDLVGCGLNWPESHPLVFISGCRTVELSPDDLLTFVTTFTFCQAAGVIGAEITIPESLAREFAAQFFEAMLQPNASVGEAIRRERLSLLSKYNLLGLAYTAFCHSSLHFRSRPVSAN